MLLFFIIISNFSTRYQDFLNSPQNESIFVSLTRQDQKIEDFREDPVVLWFWRTNAASPAIDSMLENLPIERNFYLSAVLRWEATEIKDQKAQLEKIDLALHFDTLAIENFVSLLALAINSKRFDQVSRLLTISVFDDFRNQIFIYANLIILFIYAVFLTGCVFVLVKAIHFLPLISHRLDPMKHGQFKGIIVLLVLLVPVLVMRNMYLVYIIYAFLLSLVLSGRERNWLRLQAILLILLSLTFPLLNSFTLFLKGNDRTYELYRMVAYDSDVQIVPKTQQEKEIVAYALKKQEKLEDALSLYEDLYYNDHDRNAAVINNLANIYAAYEEFGHAETLYLSALTSNRGESYFNLALLKYNNIEYLKAGEYMEEARQRGFSSLSKEPVDIKPDPKVLYKGVLSGVSFSPGSLPVIYLLPVLLILIFTFLPFKFAPPFSCPICGQPLCKHCIEEVADETFCKDCFTKLKSTKSSEIEEDLRTSLGRNKRLLNRLFKYMLNLILPGAGLIYKNRNFTGLVISFIAICVYLPLLLRGIFLKPSGWIALPLGPVFASIALVTLIFCYIVSFILMGGGNAD